MPGSTPPTSQLDWLISMTAMIVLFWSRATRDLLKSFGWGTRHSIGSMQRRSCHFLAARPIASLGPFRKEAAFSASHSRLEGRPKHLPRSRPTAQREDVYFRTADFFGGADLFRGAPFGVGGLRASLTALPAWNRTALLAAILMLSPVRGFRPSRAGRSATLKIPRPETRTASAAKRASRTAFTTAFTAWPTVAWFSSVA